MSIARPSPGFAFSHPAHAIALGFGAGLSPYAPGTVGTLVAWPLGWYAAGLVPPAFLAATIAPLFALGIWACALTWGAPASIPSKANPRSVKAVIPGSVTSELTEFTRMAPKFGSAGLAE